ncbi:hypothetical protein ACWKWP_05750 [Agromyces soli]
MYVSETVFTHLAAAADARLAQELERRRVIADRLAASPAQPGRRGRRGWFQRAALPAHSPFGATA